jgi:hypothetical protein
LRALRAWPVLLLLAGCGLFGGGAGGRRGRGEPTTPTVRTELDVTLVSRCAHPVEVCYASEKCLTLSGSAPRLVHAVAVGNSDVFVSLKGTAVSVFADLTFNMVEIDHSCAHLDRKIGPR